MSLLTIVQNAAVELGLPQPSAVIGATNKQTIRWLRAVYRAADRMMREMDWPELVKVHSFDLVDATTAYDLPTDFNKLTPETEWDQDNSWRLLGPNNPANWNALKYGTLGAFSRWQWRIQTATALKAVGQFHINPTPAAGDAGVTLSFEYQSKSWIIGGTPAALTSTFTADTDTIVFDENLISLGAKVMMAQWSRLPHEDFMAEWMNSIKLAIVNKQGAETLSLSPIENNLVVGLPNIPETGFGS